MTKGNSTSVIAIRLHDAVVARIKTMARRRRQTVNEMLKKLILGFVVGNYYSEEQVAELCEFEPLAWRVDDRTREIVSKIDVSNDKTLVSNEIPMKVIGYAKVGRNDPCPCGAKWGDGRPKKFKHCHGK